MHVLIVEDDAVSRTIIQKSVRLAIPGCEVAEDGLAAWQLIQEKDFDVVISDWMMPGLDGVDLCRRVRERNQDYYTYFILLTGFGDKEHLLNGLEAGADDFLAKPVDPRELRARLKAAERVTSLYHQLAEQTRQLESRTETLQAVTREQEAFLYTVSHDLRAPLVAIQGMIGIVAGDFGTGLDARVQQLLSRVDVNAHKMKAMLDDLLELSSVGRLDTHYEPVDLGRAVDDVSDQLSHTLGEREAILVVERPLPTVLGSPTPVRQLFANLIDNAVKYTPMGRAPRINISAHDRGELWEITVADNGVGIPAAYHQRVFGLFQRLPGGKALNPAGSGAGLAIVSRVVETAGGALWLESEEGVGSTFHFTLPKYTITNALDKIIGTGQEASRV